MQRRIDPFTSFACQTVDNCDKCYKCFDGVEVRTMMDEGLTNGRCIVNNLEAVKGRQEKEVEIFQEMLFLTQLHLKWN